MADCYYHGYSGGSGPCPQCERNLRAGRSQDDDGPVRRVVPQLVESGKTPSGKPRYDNQDQPAGAPMFFYCTECGEESDRVREDYDPRNYRPRKVCDACEKKAGKKKGTEK